MAQVSDWQTEEAKNTHLDELTLSGEGGLYTNKIMCAVRKKFDDVDGKLSKVQGAYVFKGTKDDMTELEAVENPDVGDTYNVTDLGGENYAWNGTAWDSLGTSDANVVHKTGNETIGGVKTFVNTSPGHVEGDTVTDLVIRNPEVIRGTPLTAGDSYTSIVFADAEGDTEETFAGRLGLLSVLSPKESGTLGTQLSLRCYKFTDAAEQLDWSIALTVGYDADGVPYASAPPTSSLRTEDNDIVTRSWIPQDTRIVHTTGNELVAGLKTFSGAILTGTASLAGVIASADATNAQSVQIYGGREYSDGAVVSAFGSAEQYSPGYVVLRPGTSATVNKKLIAKPDGTLTWDGQAIQTSSDERIKTPLAAVPDAVLDAWGDVQWGQFQYLEAVQQKGEAARLHLGLIAQRVKAAFELRGLDACEYGILCHEQRPAIDEQTVVVDAEAFTDEDGVEHPAITHIETRHEDAVDIWMVRYEEAQAMEAAYQRRRADRLEARIEALEAASNV